MKAVKGSPVGRKGLRANKSLDLSSRLQPKPSLAAKRVRLNRNFGGGKVNPSNTGRIRNNRPRKMNTSNTTTTPRRLSNKRGRVRSDNFGNQRLNNSNREDTFRARSRGRGRGRGRRGGGGGNYQYDYTSPRGGGSVRRGNRGGFRGGRGRGRGGRGSNQGNSQEGNRFRQSKQRFQNRWSKRRANLDKGTLDKDLDAYMAKTRGQLDADLDAYMSGV